MATKVGEGYIEIKPRLVGFNRNLLRDARARIRELEAASKEAAASVSVKPKITGITKVWQREIQQELNQKINGLTVDVKVKLQNNNLKAAFGDVSIQAQQAAASASKAFGGHFGDILKTVKRDMREVETEVKTGLRAFDDQKVKAFADGTGDYLKALAQDIEHLTDTEVTSLRNAANEHGRLSNLIGRESKKAAKDFEENFRKVFRETDDMVNRFKTTNQIGAKEVKRAWADLKLFDDQINTWNTILDHVFPDLNKRLKANGEKSASFFSSAFGKSLKSNFFDNISEGLLSLGGQFALMAVTAQPLITALANLAGGLVSLATVAVDVYGSMAALPAVWSAVAQATGVLTAAFWGVGDALNALQNEQQHAQANLDTKARQIAAAQEQVADAKERLKRAWIDADERIAAAEEALVKAQEQAAKRVQSAQDDLAEAQADAAEAVESANERIADAQKALGRAYESAADRVSSAERRHVDALERVRDAQLEVNDAYKDALRRFRDLNVELGNAVLDEEGARLAIERAREKLNEVMLNADGKYSDLDKREADLAYRESLQRLNQLQVRNSDLAEEIAEANRSGLEGSKEVTDAKQKLLDAIEAEKEAQAEIAQAHKDASEQILDAQERVAEAQADAVKAQLDGAKRIQEAQEKVAEAQRQGAEDIADAQKNIAKAHKDSAESIADAQKAVKRAMEDLAEAQGKQNEQWYNARYAMSQLSPEAQKFVLYLNDTFLPKLKEVQFHIQDAFFPPIRKALEDSGGLLDLFDVKLTHTAEMFGRLIGWTLTWLETPEAKNQLGNILDSNNRLFGLLSQAGFEFAQILLTLAEAAGPFLEKMGQLLLDFSVWLNDVVNSKEGREELNRFFENVAETIRTVYDIAKLVGGVLYEVYKLARPYGQELLGDIKDIAERFSDWVHSTEGKTQIEKFLENGKRFLQEIFKLIEAVAKAFFEFGTNGDMSGIITSLREDLLPAILRVVDAFGGGNGGGGFIGFIKTAAFLLDAFAGTVSLVAAAVSGIGAIFTGDWSGARDSFADFMDSVRGRTLSVLGGVLPESWAKSSEAANNWIRGSEEGKVKHLKNLDELSLGSQSWESTNAATTGAVALHYQNMSSEVSTETGKYVTDLDSKTKDAKAKAEENSKATREAMYYQMQQMRVANEQELENYRKAVDQKTQDAKRDSNRNLGDLVKDSVTLLVPLTSVFREAAQRGQDAMKNPGASWYDVGKSVIDGLWQGVKDLIPNFLTSVWNLGVDIVNTVRKALDSHSPSRKMMAVGKDVGEGLSLGIESMTGKVSKATKKLAQSVTNTFGSPELNVEVGGTGRKVVPTLGAAAAAGVVSGPRNVNYINVTAAPTIPTEKQISNVLKYQDALYG